MIAGCKQVIAACIGLLIMSAMAGGKPAASHTKTSGHAMEPQLELMPPFTIAGISVRTINSDESNPATAKLGGLWNRFYSGQIIHTIPNRVPDSPVYGVYSNYETDFTGHYTTTAGVQVTADASGNGLNTVHVEGGDYLVFENKGAMPGIVAQTWNDIWKFFSNNSRYVRRYTTDFEQYRGPDDVAIYIAVREKSGESGQ